MKTILVIEDETSVRENIVEILTDIGGFRVLSAANGHKGLEMAQGHHPDLVVCDLMMPELDGFGVLATLQKDRRLATIPFIFLTARTDREAERTGMAQGADDYITKPFEAVELITAVRARLDKQAALTTEYTDQLQDLRHNLIISLPHELRTPIMSILGAGEILHAEGQALPAQEFNALTKIITESAQRLEHLAENYLLYAQIELWSSDQEQIEQLRQSEMADHDEIIRALALEKARSLQRTVHLNLNATNCYLPLASDSFQKMCIELLDNAFKFSPAETAVVVRSAIHQDVFHLSIENQGRGMTEEQINRVGAYMQFERKLHEQQGSGLGLIISKRLAELFNGQLMIKSTPNEKTTVILAFPVLHTSNHS